MFFGYGWNWISTGVADPYAFEGTSVLEILPVLFIFSAILGLIIAKRWEGWGAVISLFSLFLTVVALVLQGSEGKDSLPALVPYLLTIIITIPATLFLVCSYQGKKLRYFIDSGLFKFHLKQKDKLVVERKIYSR